MASLRGPQFFHPCLTRHYAYPFLCRLGQGSVGREVGGLDAGNAGSNAAPALITGVTEAPNVPATNPAWAPGFHDDLGDLRDGQPVGVTAHVQNPSPRPPAARSPPVAFARSVLAAWPWAGRRREAHPPAPLALPREGPGGHERATRGRLGAFPVSPACRPSALLKCRVVTFDLVR